MKRLAIMLVAMAAFVLPPAIHAQPANDQKAAEARTRAIADRLHPVTGDVRIPGANATLHLGENYYFLPATEARIVLVEGWGNPADAAEGILGMVFPADRTFADDTWGAVITYEPSGYVSDSDAETTDYDALLREMQEGAEARNEERTRAGYPATHVVSWAQAPTYDRRAHSVIWARNLRFDDGMENVLNYDIRLLGRRGVLSLNMVTVMSKLTETRQAAQRFASAAEFTQGERYADYQPGTDRVAEYGIAGLIAAGVGATVAKKAGLLALIFAFGKKIIIFVIAGLALIRKQIMRLFGRKEEEEEHVYEEAAPAETGEEPQPVAAAMEAGSEDQPPPAPPTT
jgi:uncharacterized membrane-anchored protein